MEAQQENALPSVSYYAAGQSWCGYSKKQESDLANADTSWEYLDCSKSSDQAGHEVCQMKARGFPYQAACVEDKCEMISVGYKPVESLEQLSSSHQQEQSM